MKTARFTPSGVATIFGGIVGAMFVLWFLKKQKPVVTPTSESSKP